MPLAPLTQLGATHLGSHECRWHASRAWMDFPSHRGLHSLPSHLDGRQQWQKSHMQQAWDWFHAYLQHLFMCKPGSWTLAPLCQQKCPAGACSLKTEKKTKEMIGWCFKTSLGAINCELDYYQSFILSFILSSWPGSRLLIDSLEQSKTKDVDVAEWTRGRTRNLSRSSGNKNWVTVEEAEGQHAKHPYHNDSPIHAPQHCSKQSTIHDRRKWLQQLQTLFLEVDLINVAESHLSARQNARTSTANYSIEQNLFERAWLKKRDANNQTVWHGENHGPSARLNQDRKGNSFGPKTSSHKNQEEPPFLFRISSFNGLGRNVSCSLTTAFE